MQPLLIGIPVKPFGVAKGRLAPLLDAPRRSFLGREVAARTIGAAAATGVDVAVVTADEGVASWARDLGVGIITDPGKGLDEAATTVVSAAEGRPWMILHADLPLVSTDDILVLLDGLQRSDTVISPSYNGGTSALGSKGAFPFRYGPASFRAHLALAAGGTVIVRLGLALDLDTPADFIAAQRHPCGEWLVDGASG
jgi:2-phospho-L-lactate/phosphoenolpyruvate guanylyltransferase